MLVNFKWLDIYSYFLDGGAKNFVYKSISNIIISICIATFPIFFFGFIDLEKVNNSECFSDIIRPFSDGIKHCSIYILICSFMFFCFVCVKIMQFCFTLPTYISIYNYLKNIIGIDDDNMIYLDWFEFLDMLKAGDTERDVPLDELAREILRYDNYIISLAKNSSIFSFRLFKEFNIKEIPITNSFLSLFKIALTGVVFDSDGQSLLNGSQTIMSKKKESQLKKRFYLLGILILLMSPFIFMFQILYLTLNYFQTVRNTPNQLNYKTWSPKCKYKIRQYNEFPHLFTEKLSRCLYFANLYLESLKQPISTPIFSFITFFSGSFISSVLVIGLFTDFKCILLTVISGKTVAWFLAVFTTIYSIASSISKPKRVPFDSKELLDKIQDIIELDVSKYSESSHSWLTQDSFGEYFKPLWQIYFNELISAIINPIIFLFILPDKSSHIIEFVKNNSVYHKKLGWILSFSFAEMYSPSKKRSSHQKDSTTNFKGLSSHPSLDLLPGLVGFDGDGLVIEDNEPETSLYMYEDTSNNNKSLDIYDLANIQTNNDTVENINQDIEVPLNINVLYKEEEETSNFGN